MKTRKHFTAALLSGMVLLTALTGCGGSSSNTTENTSASSDTSSSTDGSDTQKNITVICMALNSDYWHMVEAGAKLAGKDLGCNVNVIGPNAESDSAMQINMVEDAINNQADAIVLAPNEPTSLVSAAQSAKTAGVPLVVIDAKLNTTDDSLYSCFIGTGNIEAGGVAGDFIAENLQKGDEVAIIRGLVGQTVHDQRTQGCQDALEAAGMQVVSVQPADSDRGKAVSVAENMLQANPNIKAFYATNDDMALGAEQAVLAAGRTDIIVVGFDGTFNGMDSITKGEMTASIAQQPIQEGYLGVQNALKILQGETVEKEQSIDVMLLTKDTVPAFRKDVEAKIAESGVQLS